MSDKDQGTKSFADKYRGAQLHRVEVTNNRAARHVLFSVPRGIVELCGPNGSGKTSTMDAILRILMSLRGADFRKPQLTWDEIRGGTKLDLGILDAEMVLTETNSDAGGKVKAQFKDGTPVPMDDLVALFGDVYNADPLEMTKAKPAELIALLQKLAGSEYCAEADRIESAYEEACTARKLAKDELKRLGTPPEPGPEPEIVSVEEVMARLQEAQTHNEEQARRENALVRTKDTVFSAERIADRADQRVQELEDALKDARAEAARAKEGVAGARAQLDALPAAEAKVDTRPLQNEIARAGEQNKARERWQETKQRFQRWQEAVQAVSQKEARVTELKDAREKHGRTLKLPVDGLGWHGGQVTINGRPWEDESTSSLLKICGRLLIEKQKMAGAIGLALLFIHRGESLDQKSFDEFVEFVGDEATVVMEKVGEPHKGAAATIWIENGYGYGEGERPF